MTPKGLFITNVLKKSSLMIVVFLFFVANAAYSAGWPHDRSDLKADPDVIWAELDNGFRYVLMKNNEPKNRVSMHLNVQVGSLVEKEDERGLAHFLEHMLFQGSENFPPGELVKYFQSIGMQFGPDANAHTGFDETVYDIFLPDGGKDSIADGLLVMKDYAQGALLLEDQIESERKIILAEKRSRDSASYRTFEATFDFEFPESLLSRRLPIGNVESIKRADRSILKGFYDAWYRPENMMMVMVGDFDPGNAAALIEDMFADLSARAPKRSEPDLGKIRHFGIKPFYHLEEEMGDATVSIEVLEMVEEQPDSAEFQKWMLKKNVADAIVQNRLESLLRKPGAPFTSASVGSSLFLKRFFYAEISAKSGGENWEKSMQAIEQELRRALQYGFTRSELERVKKEYMTRLKTAVDKSSTRETRRLARQIIRNINSDRVFMSPQQEFELLAPAVEELTVEQVHDAFKDSWNKRHRLVLVTGNAPVESSENSPEAYVLAQFNRSRNKPVDAPEEQALVEFPYLPAPENRVGVREKKEIADLGIVQIDFENGLRLNYKRTDFKAKEILAEINFGPGESGQPMDKPGLSNLAKSVLNESGVGPLNADELNRALAGKNTSVEFDIEEDSFVLRANTTTDEIDLMFQLLYAFIVDPAFRQDAFDLAMDRYKLAYLENSRSIEGAVRLYGNRFLAGGDSRFGLPEYSEYQKLTLDDVRLWIGAALKKYPLELSVVGDFQPMDLENSAALQFGGLEPRKWVLSESIDSGLPQFPAGDSLRVPVKTEIPKAIAMVAYPTDDFWEIHRTRRLSILGEIVSERLRVTVREKLGASYSPYAYNRSSRAYPGYGMLKEVVFAEPKKVQTIVDVMKKIAEDIHKEGIDEDELQRALEPTITSVREMRQKNRYWLRSVLSGSRRHPVQLDWARTILDDYSSISRREIMEMAKYYLDNQKAAEVVIVPMPK